MCEFVHDASVCCQVGVYYPYNRGALLASCVFLYAITAGASLVTCARADGLRVSDGSDHRKPKLKTLQNQQGIVLMT